MAAANSDLDTDRIKDWRSIVALVVFVITNLIVLFPFKVPVPIPISWYHSIWDALSCARIISPRRCQRTNKAEKPKDTEAEKPKDTEGSRNARYVILHFPFNFITAPLIADLFLLAILAIGRTEVYDGTIGANHIQPIDIMVFFITLAYIAISIDVSGLIRWLAYKVLQKGGKNGHLLFLYLYTFFFSLATFTGNDPVVLGGTPFLAYMAKAAKNIEQPRAWIFAQFAMANVGSAILVSSNPANLVLAGAFSIKFIDYTANMIVPVIVTAIVMFPFMLYVLFRDERLIPRTIELHELPPDLQAETPVNPNIKALATDNEIDDKEQAQLQTLKEVLNPYLDKWSAVFGSVIMAITLITILAVNAASQQGHETPVYWITLPAAFVVFCWDLVRDWMKRDQTRALVRQMQKTNRAEADEIVSKEKQSQETNERASVHATPSLQNVNALSRCDDHLDTKDHAQGFGATVASEEQNPNNAAIASPEGIKGAAVRTHPDFPSHSISAALPLEQEHAFEPTTLQSLLTTLIQATRETFPTVTTIFSHLPFPLVPFAFAMFVLVQALVTKGWVAVFAYGWQHWVHRTGTIGGIGGMAFLAVVLCNFAGTNIGTAILLCRVLQSWVEIGQQGVGIEERTFWATVYALTLGLNFGAFSTVFSASLAGLLWRGILKRKGILVGGWEFARVNLPIIVVSMVVGCAVLVGEVYIVRGTAIYRS